MGRPGEEEEDRLLSHDVRGVLRRGAAEGYAEVDFLGKDGRRYRSRWAVWRARKKAEGRFRSQEMSLTDVASGQTFGRTKSEVLEAIEQRLGLSFDQFRRSALLAQGEFAAFLRADANERAELLERMTGTEVYSRVSIAAHERNKAEQEELEKHGGGAGGHLPPVGRGARRGEAGAQDEEAARAKERRAGGGLGCGRSGTRRGPGSWRPSARPRTALARAAEAVEAAAPREAHAGSRARGGGLPRARGRRRGRGAGAGGGLGGPGAAGGGGGEGARGLGRFAQAELGQAERARTAAQAAEESAGPALAEAARLDAQLAVERREARRPRSGRRRLATAEEQASKRALGHRRTGDRGEARRRRRRGRGWPGTPSWRRSRASGHAGRRSSSATSARPRASSRPGRPWPGSARTWCGCARRRSCGARSGRRPPRPRSRRRPRPLMPRPPWARMRARPGASFASPCSRGRRRCGHWARLRTGAAAAARAEQEASTEAEVGTARGGDRGRRGA